MDWFRFVFPLVMILSPLVASCFVRVHPDPGQDASARAARIATLRRRLWLATVVAVGAFLLLYFAVSPEASYYMWTASFPLWFLGTMPLLQTKDRGWRPMQQRGAVRSATLQRRDVEPPALRRARLLAWAAWAALFGATIVAFVVRRPGWFYAWMLTFPLFGGGWVASGAHFARMTALEPEPIDASGSPELAAGYAEFRRYKLWGWFVISMLAMLCFSVPPLLIALDPDRFLYPAVWIGGGGGALVGVAGAAYGMRADLYRARLNRLYQDLYENRVEGV